MKIVSYIKGYLSKYKLNSHIEKVSEFIINGGSFFHNNFRLIITKPVKNKIFLEVGDDTILDCVLIFESEEGKIKIGSNCWIGQSNIICRNSIVIEDNVFIAYGITIYDHDSHSLDYTKRRGDIAQQLDDHKNGRYLLANKHWDSVKCKPVRICSDAWIGMNSIILKGVTIGEGAVIGAGSVVTKDVEPWTIVAGNPAKYIRKIESN